MSAIVLKLMVTAGYCIHMLLLQMLFVLDVTENFITVPIFRKVNRFY